MVGETLPLGYKIFGAALAASWSDFVTFPLDTTKVRLQVQGEKRKAAGVSSEQYKNLFHTMFTIYRREGIRALYNGLSAGLQRQVCFSSIRIGFYDHVRNFYQDLILSGKAAEDDYNNFIRILAGLTTGGMAVCVAQPTDVLKIRFQARIKDPKIKRISTLAAYRQIYSEEGIVRGLWKGTVANAFRNSVVNVGEIVTYDIIKSFFIRRKIMNDDIYCHFASGITAGIVTTFIASPIDVVKTRYMNSPKGTYRNAIVCAQVTFKEEGLKAFYKGFTASCGRITGWNLIFWITFEKVKWALENFRNRRDY